ncbi:hypothetical protein MMC24_000829 [Lignoscripta atroalba]|nr:hypothetical protein [Lignoscripta atroalba]
MPTPASLSQGSLFRYVLDAAIQFPIPSPNNESGRTSTSTSAWATSPTASRALSLLPPNEQDHVLRFHRPQDAALSLGSSLLKRLAAVRALELLWQEVEFGRDERGKPVVVGDALGAEGKTLEFNVSHHGDLVVLVGWKSPGKEEGERKEKGKRKQVGTDVVMFNWEKDTAGMRREGGWEGWVNIYQAVFNEAEVWRMVHSIRDDASVTGVKEKIMEKRLRLFYSHWCLREAYIKMTGEALLAPWLKELEFRNVTPPAPVAQLSSQGHSLGKDGAWGEVVRDFEIWFQENRVEDVRMELQALGERYMIATAVSGEMMPDLSCDGGGEDLFPAFEEIDFTRDVLAVAPSELRN